MSLDVHVLVLTQLYPSVPDLEVSMFKGERRERGRKKYEVF